VLAVGVIVWCRDRINFAGLIVLEAIDTTVMLTLLAAEVSCVEALFHWQSAMSTQRPLLLAVLEVALTICLVSTSITAAAAVRSTVG